MFGGGAARAGRAAFRQRFLAVLVLFIAIFVYFSLSSARFFTAGELDALMTSAAVLWMVAMGLTFVMLTGGFDLSLGSLLALMGIALGKLMVGQRRADGVGDRDHAGLRAWRSGRSATAA